MRHPKKLAIHPARIKPLNERPVRRARYVLYWMQQSQREHVNHALEYAVGSANVLCLPLLVGFGLTNSYPGANLRHYRFMLEGLQEVARALSRRRIRFVLQFGDPADVALRLGKQAALIVCDRGYLRVQKAWRRKVAAKASCAVVQVESDVVVPVDAASDKPEFGARTLRPKLLRLATEFLVPVSRTRIQRSSLQMRVRSAHLTDLDTVLRRMKLDRTVRPVVFRGGNSAAQRQFKAFLKRHLSAYKDHRNQPQTDDVSHMSKYLHFGQVSPVWLMLNARKRIRAGRRNVYSFVDELLVRRELAMNWVEQTPHYDRYSSLSEWARKTLAEHRCDKRQRVYSIADLEGGLTNDPYWNAAMREMRVTGYMHNHMRMYWGKKILEWVADSRARVRDRLISEQQVFRRRPRPEQFCQYRLDFRPA